MDFFIIIFPWLSTPNPEVIVDIGVLALMSFMAGWLFRDAIYLKQEIVMVLLLAFMYCLSGVIVCKSLLFNPNWHISIMSWIWLTMWFAIGSVCFYHWHHKVY